MHRSTILLGCGPLGREVLRRLLVTAALRGALTWESGGENALGGGRRLRGLELFSLPDAAAAVGGLHDAGGLFGETDLELLSDVEAQIRRLDGGPQTAATVAKEVVQAAKRLLSPTGVDRSAAQPPGLDLVVVAHAGDRAALGRLDTLMNEVFSALTQLGALERGMPGAAPLAAIALLDLENERSGAPATRALRVSLAELLGEWEARRQGGQVTFSRVLLSGEMGRHHVRGTQLRIDELSLLLELVLFEGRRDSSLNRLFQPQPAQEPCLGTFAVRLFEHSEGLLRRLAAAHFGVGWLRYLAGTKPPDEETPGRPLGTRLAPLHPDRLGALPGWEEVGSELAHHLSQLEADLLEPAPGGEGWERDLRAHYEERASAFAAVLGTLARRAAGALEQRLRELPETLTREITEGLCDGHRPLPLGSVVAELAALRAATRALPAVAVADPPLQATFWSRLTALAEEHRRLSRRRPGREWLRALWVLLSLLVSCAWVPFAREALADLPNPGPMAHPLVHGLHTAGEVLAGPLALSLVLLALTSAYYLLLLGPALERRLERAARFFTDLRQGRLTGALRAATAPGGVLARPLERAVEHRRRNLTVEAASVVRREVDRKLQRLEELRRHAQWLAGQLARFLAVSGVAGTASALDFVRRDDTGIRHRCERASELESLLRSHLAEPAVYRAVQAETRVFANWSRAPGSPFLYPLALIDRLSELFPGSTTSVAGGVDVAGSAGEEPDWLRLELLGFLKRCGSADLAFDWPQGEGVAAPQRYALLPPRWSGLPEVSEQLNDIQVDAQRTLVSASVDRAYLLTLQLGLEPTILMEHP